jgi:hypothetical protein
VGRSGPAESVLDPNAVDGVRIAPVGRDRRLLDDRVVGDG